MAIAGAELSSSTSGHLPEARIAGAFVIALGLLVPVALAERLRFDIEMPQPLVWDISSELKPYLKDGDKLTPEQLASRGANTSLIHVDWMIGSNRIDVDGVSAAGNSEPVMHAGEWV